MDWPSGSGPGVGEQDGSLPRRAPLAGRRGQTRPVAPVRAAGDAPCRTAGRARAEPPVRAGTRAPPAVDRRSARGA